MDGDTVLAIQEWSRVLHLSQVGYKGWKVPGQGIILMRKSYLFLGIRALLMARAHVW